MNILTRIVQRLKPNAPRSKKIRRVAIGGVFYVSCPLMKGMYRPATDCAACQHNLGATTHGRQVIQLCAFGVKARKPLPLWVQKLRERLRQIHLYRPRLPVRFRWKKEGTQRPVSRIQQRHRERLVLREQIRAKKRQALAARTKTGAARLRLQKRGNPPAKR